MVKKKNKTKNIIQTAAEADNGAPGIENETASQPMMVADEPCHYGDCTKYLKDLAGAADKARNTATLVGADTIAVLKDDIRIITFITEAYTEYGPFSDVKKPNGKSVRPKDWSKPQKQEIGNLDLLRAMAHVAKDYNKCLDIFATKPRLRSGTEHYNYNTDRQDWVVNSRDGNLKQLGVKLQGCINSPRGEPRINGKRSPCPVGCSAVRVHEVDIRLPERALLQRQKNTKVSGDILKNPMLLQTFLELLTTSIAVPDEEETWKAYRIALYGTNKDQDWAEYKRFRKDIRVRQRRLFAKREGRLPKNLQKKLRSLTVAVFFVWIQYQDTKRTKVTWEMMHMIQTVYYLLLRMLSMFSTISGVNVGCTSDMEGRRFPMRILCQIDHALYPIVAIVLHHLDNFTSMGEADFYNLANGKEALIMNQITILTEHNVAQSGRQSLRPTASANKIVSINDTLTDTKMMLYNFDNFLQLSKYLMLTPSSAATQNDIRLAEINNVSKPPTAEHHQAEANDANR
jgi:hypothetical protein